MITTIRPRLPLSLRRSLGALRHGGRDPSIRLNGGVVRATRTPEGAATVRYLQRGDEVTVEAWGPGASWSVERAPDLLGAADDLEGWEPHRHRLVADMDRRNPGLRMIASGAVLESAIPLVLEQKVTTREAHDAWRRLVWALGEPAPGPFRLRLRPSAERLAATPYWAFHRFGIERRRADVIRRLAARAVRVEEAATLAPALRRARLEAFPGVGVWTSAKVATVAWADPDAVAVGDYHVAPIVVHALTGRRGGDDDAMLDLLEPFRGHRGRAATLIMLAGLGPERRHHGQPLRDFRAW